MVQNNGKINKRINKIVEKIVFKIYKKCFEYKLNVQKKLMYNMCKY